MHKLKVIGLFTFGKNSTFVESRFLSTHNGIIGWGTTKPFSSSSSFFSKWRKSHFSPPSFVRRTERWEMGTINAKPQTQKGCNAGGSCNKEAVKFSNFSSLGVFWKEKKKSKLGNWGNLSTDAFFLKKARKAILICLDLTVHCMLIFLLSRPKWDLLLWVSLSSIISFPPIWSLPLLFSFSHSLPFPLRF